jgi:hypothetical protein
MELPFLGILTLPQGSAVVPYLGAVGASDNRGTIDIYLDSIGPRPVGHDKAGAALWSDLFTRTNNALSKEGAKGGVAVGFRNGIYNVNALDLDYLLKAHSGRPFHSCGPRGTGNTTQGYRDWLTSRTAAHSNFLLTSPWNEREDLLFEGPYGVQLSAVRRVSIQIPPRRARCSLDTTDQQTDACAWTDRLNLPNHYRLRCRLP